MVIQLEQGVRDTNPLEQTESEPDPPAGASQSGWRFRLAVLQHHKTVYRVCHGLLRDAHEAEDVTQETFLRYWQLSGEVRGARGWLVTVARNKCLDRLRASKRFVDAAPEIFEQQTDCHDPEWHASNNEIGARLRHLINGLPEPQRSLIVLFDIQGMTGAECAEILDLNVNQVKVYLHRARRKLRQALEESRD
jgi:RNA polymerase sigma-70 factor (ECF subfamily)